MAQQQQQPKGANPTSAALLAPLGVHTHPRRFSLIIPCQSRFPLCEPTHKRRKPPPPSPPPLQPSRVPSTTPRFSAGSYCAPLRRSGRSRGECWRLSWRCRWLGARRRRRTRRRGRRGRWRRRRRRRWRRRCLRRRRRARRRGGRRRRRGPRRLRPLRHAAMLRRPGAPRRLLKQAEIGAAAGGCGPAE